MNRRVGTLLLVALGVVAIAAPVLGQDASDLLSKGVRQYEAYNYELAKKTLLDLDRDALDADQRGRLDEYLAKVDVAIRRQRSAMEAYNNGDKALRNNELDQARQLYQQASSSEYLPPQMRKAAAAQVQLVEAKIEAAAGATNQPQPETTADVVVPADPPEAATETDDADVEVVLPASDGQSDAQVDVVVPAGGDAEIDIVIPGRTDDSGEPTPLTSPDARPPGDGEDALATLAARKEAVQVLLRRGASQLDEGKYALAQETFGKALELDPDNARARRLMNQAAEQLRTEGGSSILSRALQNKRIRKQAAKLEFDKAVNLAMERLTGADEEADFEGALSAARVAGNVMETNKSLFTATEYRDMKQRVDQLVEYVEFKRDEWQQAEAEQQLQKIREVEAERTRRARQEKQRKINSLISEAKALHSEQEYEKAVVVLEQVLKIDPTNSFARERQPMWVEDVNLNREAAADTMSRRQERLEMVNIRETGIPWHQLLRYPRNWRELTEKRKEYSLGAERLSEEDRRARQKLQTNIKSVDFSDVPFEDVLDFIREVTTANIYPEWNALQLAGIDRTKTVNVRLSDVSAEKLLEIVLDDVGAGLTELTYIIDRGVVQISTREALAGKTRIEVYDIRDLIVPIEDFDAPDMDFGEVSTTGTDGTGGGGGDDGGIFGDDDDDNDDDGDDEDTESRSEIRDKIIAMIEEGTPAESWKINGGQGSLYIFNDQLVVTQTPDNHAKIKRMLDMLREAKDIQVSIEARFITVNTGFLDDIGIDLDFYFNLGSTLSMDPALTSVDPTTGATVPGRGNNPWIVGNPDVYKLSRRLTPMGFNQDSSSFTNQLGSGTGVPNSIGGLVTSSAMTLGGTFLDDIQVDFLIRATQAHQATRSLTAPRVTLLNGRQAFVQVGTLQAYVSNLEPVISENAVTFNPTVSYVSTGSTLEVRATVSADRRYVTLTLRPQVTSLNGFSRYFTQVEETDPNGEPIAGEGFIQLPNVTVQTVETQVAVPDGGTLLLGGQKLAGEVEREMGVPMLDKVPWLNRLFTNRGKTRDEQTLLILVKPKILIQPEAEAEEKLYQEEPMLP